MRIINFFDIKKQNPPPLAEVRKLKFHSKTLSPKAFWKVTPPHRNLWKIPISPQNFGRNETITRLYHSKRFQTQDEPFDTFVLVPPRQGSRRSQHFSEEKMAHINTYLQRYMTNIRSILCMLWIFLTERGGEELIELQLVAKKIIILGHFSVCNSYLVCLGDDIWGRT